jgi:hypothetical protein
VSPADACSFSLRSRRPRRVDFAATSTRFTPQKFLSGNTAAACEASSRSPARLRRRRRRWPITGVPEDPKDLPVFLLCFGFFL